MTAGRNTRSPITAVSMMMAVSIPKYMVGVKLLSIKTPNPIHRIN